MKSIKTVGIVGAGTMGSALAQKFAQEGFNIILVDKELRFIENGLNRIKETLNEGVERKKFTSDQTKEIILRISGSDKLIDLAKCELIIEAIFENIEAKTELLSSLNNIVNSETILATNTSSFSVSELAKSVSRPERFIGMHYFYHAAKNRLVEIIPGDKTSKGTLKAMRNFAVLSGKDAIVCKDSYGFVVNRFFVPWLNEASRLLEEGIASTSEIDTVCMKTFSIGMGPFALMNVTGVPVAYHAQKTLEYFGKLYKTSHALKKQAELNKPWDIGEPGSQITNHVKHQCINERMLGMVLLVCSQILDEKICSAVEINRGARIGLRWRKGPIEMMQKLGKNEVTRLIKSTIDKYDAEFPASITEDNWEMALVRLDKAKDIAVITISRPEDMNSLNENIMCQLARKFDEAVEDAVIKKIIITGEGKAFVAGADIKFFIDNIRSNSLGKIASFTKFGQEVYEKIDRCPKTVISIVNGLALGGGLELALCSDIILAVPKALFAFPETGIGIYPGLGGTQRTQKRIGKGLTKYLIYTGEYLNAVQAVKIGLVDAVIQLEEISDIIEGVKPIPVIDQNRKILDEKYISIQRYFERYSLSEILETGGAKEGFAKDVSLKLAGKIKKKAPLALQTSEKLIDEARGCESELEELTYIFSTSDALLGLSSIGKHVEFQGK